MAERWDIGALGNYIESHCDNPHQMSGYLKSVFRAIGIFEYHKGESIDAIQKMEPKTEREAFELVFVPNEKQELFFLADLAIQANTQAALHSARSIHDLLAQLIRALLSMEGLDIESCDIKKVRREMPLSELRSFYDEVFESAAFKYVDDFVNTIKHRGLVDFGASLCLESGRGGVQFCDFKYKGRYHQKRWAEEILEYGLEVKNAAVSGGVLLNAHLGVKSRDNSALSQ